MDADAQHIVLQCLIQRVGLRGGDAEPDRGGARGETGEPTTRNCECHFCCLPI
jgi:hypothetical protein